MDKRHEERHQITRRDALRAAAGAAVALGLPAATRAAGWPDRPVRLVLPYDPGAAGDVLTRELADAMRGPLGVAVLTENKPGGGTVVGASYVASQPADGYTVLINGPATHVIMPAIQTQMPYDAHKDFESIGMWAVVSSMVSVNASLPVKTIGELVDYSKRNPGKLFYSSAGAGTGPHLGGELFKQMTGADITHVPYKGAAGATTALVAGEVQVSFVNIPPQVPHVTSGKIRALAVSSTARSSLLPDVPTASEAGLAGYVSESWFGLAVRAGTPPPVRARLEQVMLDAGQDGARRSRLAAAGIEVRLLSAKALDDYVADEERRLLPIIRSLKLKM